MLRSTSPGFLFLPVLLLFGGCAIRKPLPPPPVAPAVKASPKAPRPSYWNGDGVEGTPKIVITLGEQRAYFYKGDRLVGETRVSSGKRGFETPPGSYRVQQKDEKHVSNLYGDFVDAEGNMVKKSVDLSKEQIPEGATFVGSPMPYFLRFWNGYGLHAGRVPSYRASHGCVRLPREMAHRFYKHSAVGTPVIVQEEPLQETEPKRP
jgi:lipoprotein-anchoring transpeptidase ErfK/SrfK